MKKDKKEYCFYYIRGKCGRDAEHPTAIKPCKKVCRYWIDYDTLAKQLKENKHD